MEIDAGSLYLLLKRYSYQSRLATDRGDAVVSFTGRADSATRLTTFTPKAPLSWFFPLCPVHLRLF